MPQNVGDQPRLRRCVSAQDACPGCGRALFAPPPTKAKFILL
jgi:hypothetical protein